MFEGLKQRLARALTREIRQELGQLGKALDRLNERDRLERKWRKQIGNKIDALMRREYLADFLDGEFPFEASARRFRLFSQNEEDGMILALLQTAGVTTRCFVEIGSGSSGGNSGLLAREFGWRGLMVDIDADSVAKCRERFGDGERVRCKRHEVSPANIDRIISEQGLAGEVDLFSLDIDSFDYWVLDAMTACSPRVMVLEYNAFFGAEQAVTVPRDAPLAQGPKGYHGASLTALTKLAREKGFRLLACDPSGTNAFFLRNDLRPEIAAVPVARAFRAPRDRTDHLADSLRAPIDMISIARESGLPLEFV